MLNQSYVRSLDVGLLCGDSTVKHIASFDLADWSFIRECYKAVPYMPVPQNSRQYLKDHLFSCTTLDLLEVKNPRILLFRFPNGNVRSFVTTQSGFLLERDENYLWDSAFPFLRSLGGSITFAERVSLEPRRRRDLGDGEKQQ